MSGDDAVKAQSFFYQQENDGSIFFLSYKWFQLLNRALYFILEPRHRNVHNAAGVVLLSTHVFFSELYTWQLMRAYLSVDGFLTDVKFACPLPPFTPMRSYRCWLLNSEWLERSLSSSARDVQRLPKRFLDFDSSAQRTIFYFISAFHNWTGAQRSLQHFWNFCLSIFFFPPY